MINSEVTTMVSLTTLARLMGVTRRTVHRLKKADLEAGLWTPPETIVGQTHLISMADAVRWSRIHGRVLSA